MKKLIASLLLVVLVVPGLALAEEAKKPQRGSQRRWRQKDAPAEGRMKLEQVGGKIVSLSANTVTLAKPTRSKDDKAKAKHVKVRISDKGRMRLLLARGLGQKAQLLCRKTDKGAWVLVRVKSIEGVELPAQQRRRPGMRDRMRERGDELSSEQREKMREWFKTMGARLRKNPELRKELRELAEKDPEAFRRRIRQMHQARTPKPGDRLRDARGPRRSAQPSRRVARPTPPRRGMVRPGNPRIAKLEQQSQELSRRYRQAKGSDKEKLGQKLRQTLEEVFKLKVQDQTKQVERLARQMEKLRDQLEKRERNRELIIQKRFGQLTGEEKSISW